MSMQFDRRSFTLGLGMMATGTMLRRTSAADDARQGAAPEAKVLETRVISQLKHRYHGWPTLTQRSNGELLVVCSGGREAHVCPFGRVELMRSRNEGASWSWPEVVGDGPIDDRDAGVLETAAGSLLVTSFTSLAYQSSLSQAARQSQRDQQRIKRWIAAHERLSDSQRQAALGVWMWRSIDGGITWSGRFDCRVNSPHGPIQLSDGRLLYAGKDLWRAPHRIGVCESKDDGQTWQWLADIEPRPGDDHQQYHELHAVQAASGRLVVHIRNHNPDNAREILQTESDDGGTTWSVPHPIGVWGLPSHLLRLSDDRLLMSYGHRRAPLGNQARLSSDHGQSWSGPIMISSDGANGDLGYPSTVQLSDRSLVTVWYERMADSSFAVLRQARWVLSG